MWTDSKNVPKNTLQVYPTINVDIGHVIFVICVKDFMSSRHVLWIWISVLIEKLHNGHVYLSKRHCVN